jgi:ABC-type phosphate transport system permease subunit
VVRLWGNVAIDAALASETVDAGQVALASALTVMGWVLFVLSLLVGAAAVFLRKKPAKTG